MKEYLITVRVKDDGITNEEVKNEYLSKEEIIQQIEMIDTAGLEVKVENFCEVIK